MEPITLAVVSSLVLTEGVKFLYQEAGQLLQRRRGQGATDGGEGTGAGGPVTLAVTEPGLFAGAVAPAPADAEVVLRFREDLTALWQVLAPYAHGITDIDPADRNLLDTADAVRNILEAVYGQRLTFAGETRAEEGPVVSGLVRAEEIAGDVAGVRARGVRTGRVVGQVEAGRVTQDGTVSGIEIQDDIG
ncbi:hypothetical protein [Streptomyces sp. NBC_01006]|uniref:hypothetical protein n=1 Tax=Streptomyces sp. NBC_01006 TaxID=2903716 RepID=UPI0038639043|nr:hypothetical protein OG509_02840 [Streptomyces sp. NBC_01006]